VRGFGDLAAAPAVQLAPRDRVSHPWLVAIDGGEFNTAPGFLRAQRVCLEVGIEL